MRKLSLISLSLLTIFGYIVGESAMAQQAPSAGGVPSHIVVTVEPKRGTEVPTIRQEDVMVYQGRDRNTVTGWTSLKGDRAGLELFVLIDDELSSMVGNQLDDIRKFITEQPPTAKVGVAYMQNGIARILQDPTNDHEQAAKALRLPMGVGGANASPYISLSDLVKRWPQSNERRAVLMVSDGIDRLYGIGDLQDPYLEAAIDDAAKAGIIVSAIYSPGAGHFGHSYWLNYWGQIYLSKLGDRTGGEAYYIGFTGAPVTFTPYLESLNRRLENQYLLEFLAQPPKKAGWVQIRLRTEVQNADLISAGRVWVAP